MFEKINPKQALLFCWWRLDRFKDMRKMIVTGAIRTGKTEIGSRSFLEWVIWKTKTTDAKQKAMKGWNKYFIVGATQDTIYDNVIDPLASYLQSKGYIEAKYIAQLRTAKKIYHINTHNGYFKIKYKQDIINIKYLGADTKRAFRMIQGRTFRGGFIDESALIDIKVIETLEGRMATWKDGLVFMSSNPEGDEDHDFYKHYIKSGYAKQTLVMSFELLDNPIFTKDDEDYYKKIYTHTMFLRKIKGQWIRQSGGCYPFFSDERHVVPQRQLLKINYTELTIGVDTGYVDATVFQLTGYYNNYRNVAYIEEKYHKNNEFTQKTQNEYIDDLFEFGEQWYNEFGKVIHLYMESADRGFRLAVIREIRKRYTQSGISFVRIFRASLENMGAVNKSLRDKSEQNAIQERINFENMMLGSGSVLYSDTCKWLIKATKNAVYDDHGNRLDNPSTLIDSLDSKEYSWLARMPRIRKHLILLK